jgi:hypothetical protein
MPTTSTDASRSRAAQRTVSRPAPELAHLDLRQLRDYRQELVEEESRISYWRRLVQARIDLVLDHDDRSLERLRTILCEHAASSQRLARQHLQPAEGPPPLPDLAVLWEGGSGPRESGDLVTRMAQAEHQLSAYRRALHERLDAATNELIARYHENPSLALVALPLRPDSAAS